MSLPFVVSCVILFSCRSKIWKIKNATYWTKFVFQLFQNYDENSKNLNFMFSIYINDLRSNEIIKITWLEQSKKASHLAVTKETILIPNVTQYKEPSKHLHIYLFL